MKKIKFYKEEQGIYGKIKWLNLSNTEKTQLINFTQSKFDFVEVLPKGDGLSFSLFEDPRDLPIECNKAIFCVFDIYFKIVLKAEWHTDLLTGYNENPQKRINNIMEINICLN